MLHKSLSSLFLASVVLLMVACGNSLNARRMIYNASNPLFQEKQCMTRGWQRVELQVAGLSRLILWKTPQGPWTKGAILVLHGGGGHHFQWCVANAEIVAPQVRFAELAVTWGFAVFLLESSDQVTDSEGRLCGKVWDDEVRNRPNIDLPFIEQVLHNLIPSLLSGGSRQEVFLTGLSSGGYMTVRVATHFDGLITAFAPVSCGDPYGWHRVCDASLTARSSVHGTAFDNETGKQIIEPCSCCADSYPNEKPWDTMNPRVKPAFRVFYHKDDGIHDRSCAEKLIRQLRAHGYPEVPAFCLVGDGRRSLTNHLWQDAYNIPVLEFFTSQLDK
ncbi:MAG: hypothetical protein ABIJ37_09140 [Pseudomonadota bacterium]